MSGYTFRINQHNASLHFSKDPNEKQDNFSDKWSHYQILDKLLDFMVVDRGFKVGRDPEIEKHYSRLSKDHWYGRKGDLELKARRYPAGFELQFFQNLVFKNKCGGCYDFDKYNKMPYLIKLLYRNEMWYIKQFLDQLGCVDNSEPVCKNAEEKIKLNYVKCWHHPQTSMDFSLQELDGQNINESYNNTDKDGKTILNGDIKYFRDRKGRLMRGKVYHNINNMWWVILNRYEYRNLACFELFDLTPDNNAKKIVRRSGHHNPKARWMPTYQEINAWQKEMKSTGKEGRIKAANKFLKYLYSIDWITRCFQFVLKENGRLGLVEPKGAPNFSFLGIPRKETIYETPRPIPLYPSPRHMSSTEASWVKGLREYVVHGPGPRISAWFCRDSNGEGISAYLWPDVREKLIKMGAMVINLEP